MKPQSLPFQPPYIWASPYSGWIFLFQWMQSRMSPGACLIVGSISAKLTNKIYPHSKQCCDQLEANQLPLAFWFWLWASYAHNKQFEFCSRFVLRGPGIGTQSLHYVSASTPQPSSFALLRLFAFMCTGVWVVLSCALCACNSRSDQKRASDPLGLELGNVANFHAGAETKPGVLCKSSKCS